MADTPVVAVAVVEAVAGATLSVAGLITSAGLVAGEVACPKDGMVMNAAAKRAAVFRSVGIERILMSEFFSGFPWRQAFAEIRWRGVGAGK